MSLNQVARTGDIFNRTSLPLIQETAQERCLPRANWEAPPISIMDSFDIYLWEEIWQHQDPHANWAAKHYIVHLSPFFLLLHCSNSVMLLLCIIIMCKINILSLCKCLRLNSDPTMFSLPCCYNRSCMKYSLLPLDVTRQNVFENATILRHF